MINIHVARQARNAQFQPSGDRVAEVYLELAMNPKTQAVLQSRINWLVSHARGRAVYEIGCSQGITGLLLARNGFTYLGVDLAAESIAFARDLAAKEPEEVRARLDFQVADCLSFGPRQLFDTVILAEVIEHFKDPASVLARAAQVLTPGGCILITTPFGQHPHGDHHTVFMLENFITLVGEQLSIEQLEARDGYILCVACKTEEKTRPSAHDLLSLSEQESLAKQMHLLDKLDAARKRNSSLSHDLQVIAGEVQRYKDAWAAISSQWFNDADLVAFLNSRTFRAIFPLIAAMRFIFFWLFVSPRRTIKGWLIALARGHHSFWLPRLLSPLLPIDVFCLAAQGQVGQAGRALGKNRWGLLNRFPQTRRIKDMSLVLEQGWPEPRRTVSSGSVYNGNVLLALHNSLPHDHAGYAIRSHNILRKLNAAGIDTVACTRLGYPWDLPERGHMSLDMQQIVDCVTYRRLFQQGIRLDNSEREYVQAYGMALAQEAQRHGSRIIHAASNYLNGLAAAQAAAHVGARAVYEFRGLWHLTRLVREPWLEGTELYEYAHKSEMAAAKQCDAVVAISEALKQKLVEDGVPAGKITVVPNAVDVTQFKPRAPDEALRQKFGLEGRKVIGFIGSLTAYEGLELVMEAVARLNAAGEPVSLLIVGSGPHAQALHALHKDMGSPGHTIFTGRVPFAEVGRYYSLTELLPFPRRDLAVCRYVPPLKILEAMCMEKNVLVSALPPLQEMVVHGETGVICRPDDVDSLVQDIASILFDPQGAARMRKAARQWVLEQRDWAVVAQKYVDLYRSL